MRCCEHENELPCSTEAVDYLNEILGSQNKFCFTVSAEFLSNVQQKTVSNTPANTISMLKKHIMLPYVLRHENVDAHAVFANDS